MLATKTGATRFACALLLKAWSPRAWRIRSWRCWRSTCGK